MKRCVPIMVVVALLLVAGCGRGGAVAAVGERVGPEGGKAAASAAPGPVAGFQPAEILRNMPMNSEHRCLGITLVAEALLDGQLVKGNGCQSAEDLGRVIFDRADKSRTLHFLPNLCLDQGIIPIQSRDALDKLSAVVYELYKERHLALMTTDEGRRRIVAGQSANVKTSKGLDEILDADRDKIHAFMAIGLRQFPDASEKPTYHAVLIAKTDSGQKVVYDPNDPGAAIECQLNDTDDGLLVRYTCNYKDTGQITTQEYQIVSQETFFRLALSEAE